MIQQEQLLRTFHPGMFSTPESVARRMQPKTINHPHDNIIPIKYIPSWLKTTNKNNKK